MTFSGRIGGWVGGKVVEGGRGRTLEEAAEGEEEGCHFLGSSEGGRLFRGISGGCLDVVWCSMLCC